jgi:Fic family protein
MSADRRGAGPSAWPALGSEERLWTPTIPADLVSRAVRARHPGPYRAAVVAEIAELDPGLSTGAAALAAEASAEIARFDAELGVEIAPFAAVLLRSESASSSMIENLTSGAKAIALAELGSPDKRNATEIVGNVHAMQAALELADRLDAQAVLAMHAALLGELEPTGAGRWRAEQVWIGGDNFGPHGASFVPPHHDRVPAAMADLMRFVQRDDLPVLTQAAIAHAQFETIHPFTDGNGRTGRALIHSMLRAKGLTRRVTVPVSAGLLTDTGAYFDTLGAYRTGEIAPIVQAMANASFAAVTNGRQLVAELRDVRDAWNGTIRARRDSSAWRLADVVLRQPVIDLSTAARELGISPANALRPIAALAEAGVLTEFTGFKRNRMWQSREVLSALDDFAARAGPRRRGFPIVQLPAP